MDFCVGILTASIGTSAHLRGLAHSAHTTEGKAGLCLRVVGGKVVEGELVIFRGKLGGLVGHLERGVGFLGLAGPRSER